MISHTRTNHFNFATFLFLPSLVSSFIAINIHSKQISTYSTSIYSRSASNSNSIVDDSLVSLQTKKEDLLDLLQSTPSNAATSSKLTEDIIFKIKALEKLCPTPEKEVLQKIAGNWELLWTAQDKSSEIIKSNTKWRNYINPLENQSYSNNPTGRLNPILPRNIQDKLEKMGILSSTPIRSSQSIDINKKRVRNVVTVSLPLNRRASLIVDVAFQPNQADSRKVDVKFNACTLRLSKDFELKFPLGAIGPTGWLRTTFVDEEVRITRGHKGSVFILLRASAASSLRKKK